MDSAKPHILYVESDANMASILSSYLRDKGFVVTLAQSTDDAIECVRTAGTYAAAIVDMSLPRRSAYRLLDTLHKSEITWPVLAMSSASAVEDIVGVYDAGADDVLRKPIVPEVLVCKIHAYLRRETIQRAHRRTEYDLDGLTFDSRRQTLNGEHLSSRENDLLLMLCRNQGELVDRHKILLQLWGVDTYFAARSLHVYINHLRKLLANTNIHILAVKGKGYKLC